VRSPLPEASLRPGAKGSIPPAPLRSATFRSSAAALGHVSVDEVSSAGGSEQRCRRIEQLATPLNDSHGPLDDGTREEEVTVTDPGHPLYGRRFRVASRSRGPGAKGSYVEVLYRDGILLRIPTAAIAPPKTGQPPATKVTPAAIEELALTARMCEEHGHRPAPTLGSASRGAEAADRCGPDPRCPRGDR
jgi:hypothetical protein